MTQLTTATKKPSTFVLIVLALPGQSYFFFLFQLTTAVSMTVRHTINLITSGCGEGRREESLPH